MKTREVRLTALEPDPADFVRGGLFWFEWLAATLEWHQRVVVGTALKLSRPRKTK